MLLISKKPSNCFFTSKFKCKYPSFFTGKISVLEFEQILHNINEIKSVNPILILLFGIGSFLSLFGFTLPICLYSNNNMLLFFGLAFNSILIFTCLMVIIFENVLYKSQMARYCDALNNKYDNFGIKFEHLKVKGQRESIFIKKDNYSSPTEQEAFLSSKQTKSYFKIHFTK